MLNPGDPELIEAVSAHIARHVAPVETVFHEIISPDLHIDVHHVPPAPDRRFHALVTSGMSERPMSTGEEAAEFRFAELAILFEPNWPIEHSKFGDENVYWPIRLLKRVARFPFEAGTWVGVGHSIAGANHPEPMAPETELSSAILLPPRRMTARAVRRRSLYHRGGTIRNGGGRTNEVLRWQALDGSVSASAPVSLPSF